MRYRTLRSDYLPPPAKIRGRRSNIQRRATKQSIRGTNNATKNPRRVNSGLIRVTVPNSRTGPKRNFKSKPAFIPRGEQRATPRYLFQKYMDALRQEKAASPSSSIEENIIEAKPGPKRHQNLERTVTRDSASSKNDDSHEAMDVEFENPKDASLVAKERKVRIETGVKLTGDTTISVSEQSEGGAVSVNRRVQSLDKTYSQKLSKPHKKMGGKSSRGRHRNFTPNPRLFWNSLPQ